MIKFNVVRNNAIIAVFESPILPRVGEELTWSPTDDQLITFTVAKVSYYFDSVPNADGSAYDCDEISVLVY